MFKNKLRLAFKMFAMVWVMLFIMIFLKVTFNYWKPYTIPTEQLKEIGEFIDNTRWLQIILNGIFNFIGNTFVILCGTQQWKYKSKKQGIITSIVIIVCYALHIALNNQIVSIISTITTMLVIPMIINYRKFLYIIITFGLSYAFLFLSLFLEGFANTNDMSYIIRVLFNNDYYIMLALNYIFFNLIRMRKEDKENGR